MPLFDTAVVVDAASPPTTWTFGGMTSITIGTQNFGNAVYLALNGPVSHEDPVILGADDPGARTQDGGYVAAASMFVSSF